MMAIVVAQLEEDLHENSRQQLGGGGGGEAGSSWDSDPKEWEAEHSSQEALLVTTRTHSAITLE
jgi:hypothetical protein